MNNKQVGWKIILVNSLVVSFVLLLYILFSIYALVTALLFARDLTGQIGMLQKRMRDILGGERDLTQRMSLTYFDETGESGRGRLRLGHTVHR
jgi:methyl-accepting chemotaxis protein